MDFFGNDNPFFNSFNIDNIDSFSDSDNLHQHTSYNTDSDKRDETKVSKRVKSIRQLKNIEKELVRLSYKEAILKGLGNNITDIQDYILSKTHIFVERIGLEYLKKSEQEEDRKWYQNLAGDHFAYISIYRKAIDEIAQLQKELWIIHEDSKTTQMGKIKAIRELHKLTITSTLLLRDLPFVTNLSKFYDETAINSKYNDITQSKNGYSARNTQETANGSIQRKDFNKHENSDNPLDFNGNDDGITSIGESGLKVEYKHQSKYKNLDDEIMEDMQGQLHISDSLKNKSMQELTGADLDRIITPEHKESMKKLRKLLDD